MGACASCFGDGDESRRERAAADRAQSEDARKRRRKPLREGKKNLKNLRMGEPRVRRSMHKLSSPKPPTRGASSEVSGRKAPSQDSKF